MSCAAIASYAEAQAGLEAAATDPGLFEGSTHGPYPHIGGRRAVESAKRMQAHTGDDDALHDGSAGAKA